MKYAYSALISSSSSSPRADSSALLPSVVIASEISDLCRFRAEPTDDILRFLSLLPKLDLDTTDSSANFVKSRVKVLLEPVPTSLQIPTKLWLFS